ncbi:Nn.00g102600.m01.CDS01 [Neocucurbitaria sp. VM-36]
MGIPYSRQINAAFEQVTPLVAAGFKVLRTTRDISILLAVIQVLTVFFLGMILAVLVVLCYCVNPDLETERQQIITPWLRHSAHITVWGIIKSVITTTIFFGVTAGLIWKLFLVKQWVADVEYEGNVDADKALEDLNDDEDVQKKAKKGKEEAQKEEAKGGKK